MSFLEAEIIGHWNLNDGIVEEDENCQLIEKMLQNDLIKVSEKEAGWQILYQDQKGSFWELSYPNSDWHGGGPSHLKKVAITDANQWQ